MYSLDTAPQEQLGLVGGPRQLPGLSAVEGHQPALLFSTLTQYHLLVQLWVLEYARGGYGGLGRGHTKCLHEKTGNCPGLEEDSGVSTPRNLL